MKYIILFIFISFNCSAFYNYKTRSYMLDDIKIFTILGNMKFELYETDDYCLDYAEVNNFSDLRVGKDICLQRLSILANSLSMIPTDEHISRMCNKSETLCKNIKKSAKTLTSDANELLNEIDGHNEKILILRENRKAIELEHKIKIAKENEISEKKALESIRLKEREDSEFCETNYVVAKNNDLKGINETNIVINNKHDISDLIKMKEYKYITPLMRKACLEQERYIDISTKIKISKENIDIAISEISRINETKREIVVHKNSNKKTKNVVKMDSEEEFTDKMTTYSVISGRAIACDIDLTYELERVGLWMDSEFNRLHLSNKIRSSYQLIFTQGMYENMQYQKNGNSPDTCSSIAKVIKTFPWP
jgi:hypothetical protein